MARRRGRRAAAVTALVVAAAVPGATPAGAQSAEYLDHAGLTRALRSVVNGSELATMRAIGESLEGREIWLVRLAAGSGPPIDTRPALLVVGNLSGDHLLGSHLALDAVRYLAGPGAAEADLENHVIYVVPRLNPDGAEAMFDRPAGGTRLNARPFDADNDGRVDEDGPEDLDGNGVITLMRVPDPAGELMVDGDDARLMKRANPAQRERGGYTLYTEGRDSDGDGFLNEDGPGGVDLDRNFQHRYPYWQPDAGRFMVSEPESRALMDFVTANRNIGAIVTFGHSDNLVTPPNTRGELAAPSVIALDGFAAEPNEEILQVGVFGTPYQPGGLDLRGAQPGRDNDPQSGRRPAVTVHEDDREYFRTVSDAYREITGIEQVGIHREPAGAFFEYGYYHFGVPSFSTPGWALPEHGAEPDASPDAKLLAAFDSAGIDGFVAWSPYRHPDLGDVEIGGFRPYATTNPPAAQLASLGEAHGRFLARLASMLPRVRIADAEVTAHGGGVFTVTATVVNEGYFPSSLRHGVVARSVDPVTVQIQVDPDAILTGAAKTHRIQKLDGSGTRESVSWVIRGRPGAAVEIRARAQKGGTDSATVTLR